MKVRLIALPKQVEVNRGTPRREVPLDRKIEEVSDEALPCCSILEMRTLPQTKTREALADARRSFVNGEDAVNLRDVFAVLKPIRENSGRVASTESHVRIEPEADAPRDGMFSDERSSSTTAQRSCQRLRRRTGNVPESRRKMFALFGGKRTFCCSSGLCLASCVRPS